MTTIEKIAENNVNTEATSVTTENVAQTDMTKIEKMTNYIVENFGVNTHIFKSGGRWSVMLENGYKADFLKMKEIREYVISHSEELEEDDNT
jgi:hypothetical protein